MKRKYIAYIDESNVSTSKGNSAYVCLYILFENKEAINQKIINIEKDLKNLHTHWSEMTWKLRVKFAERVKNFDFNCKIKIYKNPIMQEKVLVDFLLEILKNESNTLVKIIIDGKKSAGYEIKLNRILKNLGLKSHKLIFMDDKKDSLVRLADFMVGLYRSYVDNENDNNTYMYNVLRSKIKILN